MTFRRRWLTLAALLGFTAASGFSGGIQDWEFNINGTDYYPAGGATFSSVPGLNVSGFNATTGLGTITITYNPGASGSYYLGSWFFEPVAVPFYNEYGMVNGSVPVNESWQLDIPEYDATSANHGSGTILDNLAAGTLSDTNSVPGTTSNYLDNCGANGGGAVSASCNDLVSMALGFNFTLASNQYEVITLNLTTTNPGGFSLEDIHPVDGNNVSQAAIYYSLAAATITNGTPITGTPEPAPALLLVICFAFLMLAGKRPHPVKS